MLSFNGGNDGYYFNALVFNDHAKNSEWELFGSRISKLWLQRPRDRRVMYNWDRGLDVPPAGNLSKAAVGYLAENLADIVFGTDSGKWTSTNDDRIPGGKWANGSISYTTIGGRNGGCTTQICRGECGSGVRIESYFADGAGTFA